MIWKHNNKTEQKMKKLMLILTLQLSLTHAVAQKSDKIPLYFADPIVADSNATIMLPVLYDASSAAFVSSKFGHGDNYYANIVFFHYRTNAKVKLFREDVFIKGFTRQYDSWYNPYYQYTQKSNRSSCMSNRWVFYFVKNDYDKNGKINSDDPSIIYVSDKNGYNLKAITNSNESAVSIDVFDREGFALIKMQRDQDGNQRFDSDDKSYYFVRLDLRLLSLGTKIEIQ
jgi:hypothetical protein